MNDNDVARARWEATVEAFMKSSATDRANLHEGLDRLHSRTDARHEEMLTELRGMRHELRDSAQQLVNAVSARVSHLEAEQRDWVTRLQTLRWAGGLLAGGCMALGAFVSAVLKWAVEHWRAP